MKLRYVALLALSLAAGLSACDRVGKTGEAGVDGVDGVDAPVVTRDGVWRITNNSDGENALNSDYIMVDGETEVSLYRDINDQTDYYSKSCFADPISGSIDGVGLIAGDLAGTAESDMFRLELGGSVEAEVLTGVVTTIIDGAPTEAEFFRAEFVGTNFSPIVIALELDSGCDSVINSPEGLWVDNGDTDELATFYRFNADNTLSVFTVNTITSFIDPEDTTSCTVARNSGVWTRAGYTLGDNETVDLTISENFPLSMSSDLVEFDRLTISDANEANEWLPCDSLAIHVVTIRFIEPSELFGLGAEFTLTIDGVTVPTSLYGSTEPLSGTDPITVYSSGTIAFDQSTEYTINGSWSAGGELLVSYEFVALGAELEIITEKSDVDTITKLFTYTDAFDEFVDPVVDGDDEDGGDEV